MPAPSPCTANGFPACTVGAGPEKFHPHEPFRAVLPVFSMTCEGTVFPLKTVPFRAVRIPASEPSNVSIENEYGEFILMRGDPGTKVLHLSARLFYRGGIESSVEHVVDSVSVDGLFVLLANFQEWDWVSAEAIADVVDPQPSHRTPPHVAEGIPYVGMGDVDQNGKINFSSARHVAPDVLNEHRNRYTLREGDFLFGKIGTLGKPVLLPQSFEYTLSANVVLVQPDIQLTPGFLFTWMQSPALEQFVLIDAKSTSQPAYGIKKVRQLPVPLPPVVEQEAIVEAMEDQLSIIDHLEADLDAKLKSAQSLRQSILRHAFTGQLVPQAPNDEPASELLKRIAAEREARTRRRRETRRQNRQDLHRHP